MKFLFYLYIVLQTYMEMKYLIQVWLIKIFITIYNILLR